MRRRFHSVVAQFALRSCYALLALVLVACEQEPAAPTADTPPAQLSREHLQQLSLTTRAAWQLGEAPLADSHVESQALLVLVDQLLAAPSATALESAKQQWLVLAQTLQPLHYYTGLAELAPQRLRALRQLAFSIVAYPVQPGFLDSVGEYAYSGLVHDITLKLDAENLRTQHGATDEEDIALGLYALGVLLVGDELQRAGLSSADLEENALAKPAPAFATQRLGPAEREQGYSSDNELPNNRRRQLLRLQAALLVEDITRLQALWQPAAEHSLYVAFTDITPQRRHLLLLNSIDRELSAIDALAGKGTSTALANQLAEARANHLVEVAQALQARAELQNSLQALAAALADESDATEDTIKKAIATAREQLDAERQSGADAPPASGAEPELDSR